MCVLYKISKILKSTSMMLLYCHCATVILSLCHDDTCMMPVGFYVATGMLLLCR